MTIVSVLIVQMPVTIYKFRHSFVKVNNLGIKRESLYTVPFPFAPPISPPIAPDRRTQASAYNLNG